MARSARRRLPYALEVQRQAHQMAFASDLVSTVQSLRYRVALCLLSPALRTVSRVTANGGAKLEHGSGGTELYRKVRLACRDGMSARRRAISGSHARA